MPTFFYRLLVVSCLSAISLFAQTVSIVGRVTDAQTSTPLPYTSVYLSNTSFATESDSSGHFKLINIPTGKYNLVASMIGYQTFTQNIAIDETKPQPINIKLHLAENVLNEVSIKAKRDKKWATQLKIFEREFFGNNVSKKQCRIQNSWVLEFEEGADKVLKASARQPLEIENSALGYKVYYLLKKFEAAPNSFALQGLVRFQELGYDDKKQLEQYEENRNRAFISSERYFLKSLVTHTLKKEGFAVYSVNDKFVGNGTVSRLNQQLGKRLLPFSDSLLIAPTANPAIFMITLPKEIEILNTNEVSYQNTYADAPYPVSWLVLRSSRVECTNEGILLNPSQAVWAGDISKQRIANMLPSNYLPTKKVKNNIQNIDNLEVEETPPTAMLLHEFLGDSLKIVVRFSKQKHLTGTLSVSVVENNDSSFVETEKTNEDTTSVKRERKSVQLGEVIVKEKRRVQAKAGSLAYITPDVVQTSDAFKDDATGNVLSRLQDRTPGVRIVEIIDDYGLPQYRINIRASKQSSYLLYEPPLILMNGVPFTQNMNDLRAVSLRDVARIEVFKTAHALFGSRGASGVINVVTKSQTGIEPTNRPEKNGFFSYTPNNAFNSDKDFKVNFWVAEKGKKFTIVVTGKTADGQSFYLGLV